ncbi:carboxylating nicotinate-nucleotide diphosphorylase [Bacillus massiliigorillae]|uniref:carboxylating nicotinate-nucleotide diphosphorylase n=1 Tax=Bacillus massiliigorillae TaxID=1243664 RepID=UPI0003A8AE4F|nr:carboxylating nicotinate-nucleotide diphosphorylase [Bacillus massiliigorillae]
MNKLKLKEMLQAFFIEDIGERDVTSSSLFTGVEKGQFMFIAKQNGIFCGQDVIETGFKMVDESVEITMYVHDGDVITEGEKLADIKGNIAALLMGERVILNLVQRMSAIATEAQRAARILEGTVTQPCDTRKTTPGLRMLEKYAVHCGGVSNHRYGLYDGVMIKDNHIDFLGSITKAVQLAKAKTGHMMKVEVETSTKEQVIEAVEAGADVIMFDNCTPEQVRELVKLVPSSIITEASGGITLENLHTYRDTGVNYISLGCLTHSVKALDISAKVLYFTVKENV